MTMTADIEGELSPIERRFLSGKEKDALTFEDDGFRAAPGDMRELLAVLAHRAGFEVDGSDRYRDISSALKPRKGKRADAAEAAAAADPEDESADENDESESDEDESDEDEAGGDPAKGKPVTAKVMTSVGLGVCTHGLRLIDPRFPAETQSILSAGSSARLYFLMNGAYSRFAKVLGRSFRVTGDDHGEARSFADLVVRGGFGSGEAREAILSVFGDEPGRAFIEAATAPRRQPALCGNARFGEGNFSVPVIFLPDPWGDGDVQVTPISETEVFKEMQVARSKIIAFNAAARKAGGRIRSGNFCGQEITVKLSNVSCMIGGSRQRPLADFPQILGREIREVIAYAMGGRAPRIRDEVFGSIAENVVRIYPVYVGAARTPRMRASLERMASAMARIVIDHLVDATEGAAAHNPEFRPREIDLRAYVRRAHRFEGKSAPGDAQTFADFVSGEIFGSALMAEEPRLRRARLAALREADPADAGEDEKHEAGETV